VHNQRDTVHFQRAVEAALADGHRLFVECTAHPLAGRPIQDIARAACVDDVVAVGSLRRGSDDRESFLGNVAAVHAAGQGTVSISPPGTVRATWSTCP
jgi:acyl transferase domain-containing protein